MNLRSSGSRESIPMDFYISPELEQTISSGLRVHFVIASLLNVIVFYCFLRKTPSNQHSIRAYLVFIQCILFFLDIMMDILIEPMPLLPAVAFYFVGLLPRAGVSLRLLLAIYIDALAMLVVTIILCLIHKHQKIINSSSTFNLSNLAHNLLRCVGLCFCVFVFGKMLAWPVNFADSDKAMSTYPVHLEWIRDRGRYLVLENVGAFRVGCCLYLANTAVLLVLLNGISWHIVYVLNDKTARRSPATKAMIKGSVVKLYIQLSAPSIFLVIPSCTNFIFILTDTGTFTTSLVLFFLMPLHSIAHSVLILFTTPSYRRFIVSLFGMDIHNKVSGTSANGLHFINIPSVHRFEDNKALAS